MSRAKKPRAFEVLNAGDEWNDLGARLRLANPVKLAEIEDALRKIVDANEILARDPFSMAMTGCWSIEPGRA